MRPAQWAMVLLWFHALAVLALGVSAAVLWRTYCENFGCIGVGIAWGAWAAAYGVALVAGLLVLRRTRPAAPLVLRTALATQLGGGVCLLAYWLMRGSA